MRSPLSAEDNSSADLPIAVATASCVRLDVRRHSRLLAPRYKAFRELWSNLGIILA